ncbi:MAG: hypothetical protein VX641_00920 [Planctomycetota bacterium]|nr:hypothetical protein [Planctomycetota bacterium]
MRLDTNHHPNPHHPWGLCVRALSEEEIIERILERRGPGSLMSDLEDCALEPEPPARIRLR